MSDRLLVRSMTLESDGVMSVELVDPSGRELPAWEPGAHLDVHLTDGLSRQYSLSGDPHDRFRFRLGVLREAAGRGGSAYVHEVLRPGDVVEFVGPRNHFRLEPAGSYVFVAGGIGITPIRALVEEMEGDVIVLYRVVSEDDLVFADELAELADRRSFTVHHVVGDHRSPEGRELLSPAHLRELVPDVAEREVYLCGPPAMVEVLSGELRRAGVARKHLHVERFAL